MGIRYTGKDVTCTNGVMTIKYKYYDDSFPSWERDREVYRIVDIPRYTVIQKAYIINYSDVLDYSSFALDLRSSNVTSRDMDAFRSTSEFRLARLKAMVGD